MKKRAVITVTGEVQSVGYREYIRNRAIELGLTGIVVNTPDGAVLIVCDGEEGAVERFIAAARTPNPPASVTDLSKEFREPDAAFADFYIARDLEKNGDLSAKGEILIKYIQDILSELRDSRKDIISEIRSGNQRIGEMDKHMGEHFDNLDNKYDIFGNKLEGIGDKLDRMAGDMKAMRELLTIFVEHFIKKETAEA